MTTYATSGKPPWAVTAWLDDTAVYIELPSKSGPPYITKFPLTEGGLSKALGLMHQIHREHGASRYHDTSAPTITTNRPGTAAQRAATHSLLKKMKLI